MAQSKRIRTSNGVVNLSDKLKDSAEVVESVPLETKQDLVDKALDIPQIPIDKSPLLDSDISIMEHATGFDNIQVDENIFGGTPPPPMAEPNKPVEPTSFTFPEDAPAMDMNPLNGLDTSPIGGSVPSEIKEELSNDLADLICDIYKDTVPELEHSFTKLDERKIKALAKEGYVDNFIVDTIVNANKDNKSKFKERASKDAKLLKKPLTKVLNEKQVKTTPTSELIIVLGFILVSNFFMIKEVKAENTQMMSAIMQRIDEINAKKEEVKDEQ
jgi:hypothetical protein